MRVVTKEVRGLGGHRVRVITIGTRGLGVRGVVAH